MTISDADWAAMTDRERDAVVRKALWDYPIESYPHDGETYWREWRDGCWRNIPGLTTTWVGFGLVVDRMYALGWFLKLRSGPKVAYATWKRNEPKERCGMTETNSAPPATALAAIRALENK